MSEQKHAVMLLAEGCEDVETVAPIDVLTRCGVGVTTISLTEPPIAMAYGGRLMTDGTIDSFDPESLYDAIICPGGRVNARSLAAHPKVITAIRHHFANGRLVAAICAAPSHVLGEAAGVLRGRRATGDPGFNDKLAASGASVTRERVTRDGNIITGDGPGAALPFGLAIAAYLVGSDATRPFAEKWGMPEFAEI